MTAAPLSGGWSGSAEPAIIAAVVSGTVALLTFLLNTRRSRIDRQRQLFAVAFGAVMAYREYPHIIRRRAEENRAEERARIGTALSDVQQQINMFAGQFEIEAPYVASCYQQLVRATRSLAGGMIHHAWNTPPVAVDEEIHAPSWIDYKRLAEYDRAYLQAVADHLGPWWAPARRRVRRPTHRRPLPAVVPRFELPPAAAFLDRVV